ncbi:GFA family protein [Phaeobacter sp. C3_T13_0]|uniref:GFA family protein n=1 Tax=Phaeobacter cretensis TaxID=3342641 RepID=UPI0039BD07EC
MEQYQGGCLCGAIQLKAVGSPLRVGICHCKDCRKHHGALFYAAAVFPEDAVLINGSSQHYKGRHFCGTCGSSVFAQSGNEIEIHLGTLETTSGLVPSYESWCRHREDWLPEFTNTTGYIRDRGPT